jgi:DNA-binding MarR family transcriptional regulator
MPPIDSDEAALLAMATSLEVSLTQVFRLFRRQLNEEARARSLTNAQHTAMRLLSDSPRRMSEIADYLDLTNSACTSLIDRLVERDLVKRQPDPADKRAVVITLTPAGQTLVNEIRDLFRHELAHGLAALRPAERYMAVGGVEAVRAALTGEPEPPTT